MSLRALPTIAIPLILYNVMVMFAGGSPEEFFRAPLIAVSMINTDFAKANQELMRNYYVAYLRGIRDYCQAYHGGSVRQAMIDLAIRTGTETRPQLLHDYPWPARSPDGQINIDSMLDMQAWYVKNKMSNMQFPADRIVDKSYIDYALKKLGPFVLENKDSKLAGCR